MGLVKEPIGIDFAVYPSTLTAKDRERISAIIAEYKQTGKLPASKKLTHQGSRNRTTTDGKRSAGMTRTIGSFT
jgi:hypothetical protein